jgi:amino acid efflux transporter
VAAAFRLLPRGGAGRKAAVPALVAVAALPVASGPYLLWPLSVTAVAWLYTRRTSRRRGWVRTGA